MKPGFLPRADERAGAGDTLLSPSPHHQRIRPFPTSLPEGYQSVPELTLKRAGAGDTLLSIPFRGLASFSLAVARRLGRKAIGIDIVEKYCELAARRCQQQVLPLVSAEKEQISEQARK